MKQDAPDELIGKVIDNFEIQDLIGRGGMGMVYRAYHPALQLYAAVKAMRPELASQSGFYERFLQEARTVARLDHPNIVDVINFGRYEDSYYLMMDYVEGPSLRELIQENKHGLPINDVIQIGWQIADVLVYSHVAGVLHRDLKPDNILLTRSVRPNRPYRVIVTDFGLVKLGQGSLLETQEGISLGTPAYMSPEQCRGEEVDDRADIYALGVLLFESLTGQRPYPIRTIFDAAKFHSSGKVVSSRSLNPTIPAELDLLVKHMMVPDRDLRLSSAADATDQLQELIIALGGEVPREKAASQLTARITGETSIPEVVLAPEEASATPTATPVSAEEGLLYVQVAYQDQWEEKVYPLGSQSIIVGRLPTSDIVLDRPEQRYVSKRHCEILVRDKRVLIRDLGSTNGTLLGNSSLQPDVFREWRPGVAVILGPFTLALKTEGELREVPSPPTGVPTTAPVTTISSTFKLSCPSAVPSRLPLLPNNPIVVGRAVECDMVLDHPHVSKEHCRVQLGESGPEIVDLRSTNGTFLGSRRLPPYVAVPWKESPTISLGPFVITLEDKSSRGS